MKRNPLTLTIGILLILIVGLLLFVFQVRQTEIAVVTTFGKTTRPYKPGAYFKWPWPIQNVYKFDQRVQNFEGKLTQGATRDSFNLLSSLYVGWRISQPEAFFPKFGGAADPMKEAEKVLDSMVANTAAGIIGRRPMADFLSVAQDQNKFAEIENEILAGVQEAVRNQQYGIDVEFLGIKKLSLPEQVTASVFERMTSERQVLINEFQFQGEAEAQKIRSDADRRAADMLSQAESEAIQIRAKGEAAAAESLAVFQKNPELANFIFRLNALENSLKDRSVLFFDQNTEPFSLMRGVGVPTNAPAGR